MKLSDLPKKTIAKVQKINCADDLKQRFYSFGIIKGATVAVEEISLAKNTIKINIDDTSVGIRIKEANTIEVEKI